MQELRYGQTPTRVPFSTTSGDGHDDTEGEEPLVTSAPCVEFELTDRSAPPTA